MLNLHEAIRRPLQDAAFYSRRADDYTADGDFHAARAQIEKLEELVAEVEAEILEASNRIACMEAII